MRRNPPLTTENRPIMRICPAGRNDNSGIRSVPAISACAARVGSAYPLCLVNPLTHISPWTEYITMLEGDVAERDRLLEAIRTELGASLSENQVLRQEIDALKKALLEGRGVAETPVLPPPAPIPVHVPAVATAIVPPPTSANASTSTPLVTPNTQKDLPTSPLLGARGFWGGAGMGLGGMGGITPVHTTLIPEYGVLGALGKPVSSVLQENMNPSLNVPGALSSLNSNVSGNGFGGPHGFDAFADQNPFTLKALDAYRMQLWGKMAAQLHAHQHQQQQQQQSQQQQQQASSQQQPHSHLVERMRPHYFTPSSRAMYTPPTFGALFSGKSTLASYPTPPASPYLLAKNAGSSSSSNSSLTSAAAREQAMVAALASQTLFKRLGSAFWDAFSGSGSASVLGGGHMRTWDAEKVQKVLEGKAVVRVVDVDGVVPLPSPRSASVPLGAGAGSSNGGDTSKSDDVGGEAVHAGQVGVCCFGCDGYLGGEYEEFEYQQEIRVCVDVCFCCEVRPFFFWVVGCVLMNEDGYRLLCFVSSRLVPGFAPVHRDR